MAELKYDVLAERSFELGVSKGILFAGTPTATTKGVAWNGLTSVAISPEGGDANDQYADNIKYLSLRGAEDTKGTIEAFTVPEELFECMGKTSIAEGIDAYFAQQTKKPFSFAYMTNVGNASDGMEASEKIHIIYNATLDPVETTSETINDSPEAPTMSFAFSTVPLTVSGYKATAHFEIAKPSSSDSSALAKYNSIKETLYGKDPTTEGGSDGKESTLLLPDALVSLLNAAG